MTAGQANRQGRSTTAAYLPHAPESRVIEFSAPEKTIGALDPHHAARLLAASCDLGLVVDASGVIRDVCAGAKEFPFARDWLGRKWAETVTVESRPKVEDLLREALEQPVARSREINHRLANGQDLPIRYSAFRIGATDRVVAVGRDLRAIGQLQQRLVEAQRATESEFLRLRSAETRYRILFQTSEEAVLIVDAASLKTVDANPAAAALVETTSGKLVGRALTDFFDASGRDALNAELESVRSVGRVSAVRAKLANQRECWLSASLFRHEDSAQIMVRLTLSASETAREPAAKSLALQALDALPDAFVVVDAERRVIDANAAFLEMTESPTLAQARGQPLDRWLGRTGVDVSVLFSNLREHGAVRDFVTAIRSDYGAVEEIEVSAAASPAGDGACYGLVLRSRVRSGAAKAADAPLGPEQARSAEQLSELVGRVPLKDLVRETVEITERMCIEASLRLTGDNRAAAAQMLGLSRQSLYDKLRRYSLGDLPQGEDDEERR
jgi:transcriptional regulator PpsR